jgi:hypothetical protein
MKQKTLLFTLLAGFSVLVLQSNDNGPVQAGTGNRTGSNSTSASCDGSGCHAANNAALTLTITITDTTNSTPLSSYVPGKKYMLRIGGASTTLTQNKFGFQASSVKASSTSTQAGTMSLGAMSTPSTSAIRTSGGLQIFEHTAPAAATGTTPILYAAACYWTAPAAGTGSVKLYGIINAVNGTGTTAGDAPNAANNTITEASSSVAATNNTVDFKVYPNPASSYVTVNAEGISNGSCTVNVYDMRGKLLSAEATDAVNGSLNTTINTSKWAAGLYFVQVVKDNQQKVIAVEKQ